MAVHPQRLVHGCRIGRRRSILRSSAARALTHRAAMLIDNEQPANAAARREGYFGLVSIKLAAAAINAAAVTG